MTNRIPVREFAAWMALAFAILLFSVSIAYSQTKTINIENENGKAHVKISKTENGVTTKIDTTFEVNNDSDEDFNFDFNFHDDEMNDDDGSGSNIIIKKFHDNDDIDSLSDEEHIVIVGKSDEKPPVLEKVISSKNGKQIFVYKRSSDKKGIEQNEINNDQKIHLQGIENIKSFPNPAHEKFTVSFQSIEKNDISIKVSDENNKEVFKENLKNFTGEYSKEINLSGKSKGNYFLRISSGSKAVSMKVVVN